MSLGIYPVHDLCVLGIDPGFASLGWALVGVQKRTPQLIACGVLRTEREAKKKQVRETDDNARRCMQLARHLRAILALYTRHLVQFFATEAQSWPRNARTAAVLGMAFGAIYALATEEEVEVLHFPPAEIKVALCGKKTATKAEVIAALSARPGFAHLPELLGPVPRGQWEHAADACGAAICSLQSQVVKIALGR